MSLPIGIGCLAVQIWAKSIFCQLAQLALHFMFSIKKMRDGILSKVSELENEEQYCKFTCRAEKDLNIFENA
jgi:hypothetical protein